MDFAGLSEAVLRSASKVELLVLDCDGVLTDGRLYFSVEGEAMKSFHVHDGQGITLWHAAGFTSAIITGRESNIARRRAEELGISYFLDNVIDKAAALDDLIGKSGTEPSAIAYMGDDIADLGPMRRVAFPVSVADGSDPVREIARYVTVRRGGKGAVREVIELLLWARRGKAMS